MSNHTSSGFTALQVGRIVPRDDTNTAAAPPPAEATPGESTNHRTGNATVDAQHDVIHGGLRL